jgi:hypothetical protein
VARLGLLTRDQLMRLGFFHSPSRAKERLKKLVDQGLLATAPHAVLRGGIRFVYLPGRLLADGTHQRRRMRQASPLFVAHQLGVVEARIAFERHTTLRRWHTDRDLAALSLGVIPDACAEYEVSGRVTVVFLEYDRGTETRSRIEQKTRAYLDLAHSGRFQEAFGRQFFRLLILTDSPRRLTSLSAAVATITNQVARFATLDELTQHGPLAAIWRRPGQSQLDTLTTS